MESVGKEKFEKLSSLSRTPPVNIEFQDLKYSVSGKDVLKSLNGKFSSGDLTAILGPSGSGKTTLLNILAGYVLNGVTGNITINGKPRQMNVFHKISAYIMQEDLLQPHLTVHESVMVTARLKLEDNINLEGKQTVVKEVLSVLGLQDCHNTRMENLSGGQRKRLSIALEMVSNPPVIFLDEPTSGLDTVAIKQCIDVLRTLTGHGRTVICTIHQPSVAIFEQFQQVYFIADGMCVYNGSTSNIIPFLSSVEIECPNTYSPAEYVIETVQISQAYVEVLVTAIQNGKISKRDVETSNQIAVTQTYPDEFDETTQLSDTKLNVNFATSFWTQFRILFGRMMLQMSRNKVMLWLQLIHHIATAILTGLLFFGIGNDAEMVISNFKLGLSIMIFFVYTHIMLPVLLFPFELAILKREYFNRWYGLKAYFAALTLRNIPTMVILAVTLVGIIYFLTNQPMELDRFIWLALPSILVAFASEGLGLAIGSTCNVTYGSAIAPTVIAFCMIISAHGAGYGSAIKPFMKIIMSTSYLRYALVAISQALFGNRGPFECYAESLYCHYKDPKYFLRDMGMLEPSYFWQILGLIAFLLMFRIMTFFALRSRLNAEISYKILNYSTKILRCR